MEIWEQEREHECREYTRQTSVSQTWRAGVTGKQGDSVRQPSQLSGGNGATAGNQLESWTQQPGGRPQSGDRGCRSEVCGWASQGSSTMETGGNRKATMEESMHGLQGWQIQKPWGQQASRTHKEWGGLWPGRPYVNINPSKSLSLA